MSRQGVLPGRHLDAKRAEAGVRQGAVLRPRRAHRHVGHGDALQADSSAQQADDGLAQAVPRRRSRVDAVVDAARRIQRQQRKRRVDHVFDVAGAHDAIDEDARRFAGPQGLDDAVDAAPGGRAAKQALDAKHEAAGRLQRQPFAHQFRLAVHAPGIGGGVFAVRRRGHAIEDEVRAVVHEPGAHVRGGARQIVHGKGVHRQCPGRVVFGLVDGVVRGAVQDDIWARALDGGSDGGASVRSSSRRVRATRSAPAVARRRLNAAPS